MDQTPPGFVRVRFCVTDICASSSRQKARKKEIKKSSLGYIEISSIEAEGVPKFPSYLKFSAFKSCSFL